MIGNEEIYSPQAKKVTWWCSVLLVGVILYSVVLLLPVQLGGTGAREALASMCWAPAVVSAWMMWKSFVVVIYGKHANMRAVSLLGYMAAFIAWSLSWALVFTAVYQLRPTAFDHVPEELHAYESWAFFVGGTFMMSAGSAPPYITDPSEWYSVLMCGVVAKINVFLALSILAIIAVVIYEISRDRTKHDEKKRRSQGLTLYPTSSSHGASRT